MRINPTNPAHKEANKIDKLMNKKMARPLINGNNEL
jgi:hypothetical protein